MHAQTLRLALLLAGEFSVALLAILVVILSRPGWGRTVGDCSDSLTKRLCLYTLPRDHASAAQYMLWLGAIACGLLLLNTVCATLSCVRNLTQTNLPQGSLPPAARPLGARTLDRGGAGQR